MIERLGTVGPEGAPRLLLLYTGGTIGMTAAPDGALVPLDLRELTEHLPVLRALEVQLSVIAFARPIDSSALRPGQWVEIADAVVAHAPGHAGVVVMHGTDTMAYTASALSFLLEGIAVPIVLTGAQRPLTEVRSDGRENLVAAGEIALLRDGNAALVPEVTVFFADVLLRGNRTTKIHADSYRGFASPNLPPLATAGVAIEPDRSLIRHPGVPPLRRRGSLCTDVALLPLHPALDEATLRAVLERPGLRGVVLEAYGSGNGPTELWFLRALERASEAGVAIVVRTQCAAGTVRGGHYATGAALLETGAVPGGDMTREAALTKLMVLLDGRDADEVRTLVQRDVAGELTVTAKDAARS